MAKVYSSVGGKKIEKFIALNDGVQGELDNRAFEIGVRAEGYLLEHRLDGHAQIEVERGRVDRYVVLNDERGQKAAMSIEYGRAAQEVEVTDPDTGEKTTKKVGEMEGLYILARAANLPKKRKGKVKLD
ncbi:hypothetical protein SEA_YOSIF_14 [Streptomyces phage Yosif]|uniref:Uncharacterized protein n=1 Tax=Streptomyces phage Yosif TaxID=2201421 RepID=A0A2Z4QC90_9CAUD|nr:tail completion or Neck1 protein [Streptomyces phage Yosif]AWY07578.1 hypothetical protein SEA_YOSIF_14 [Streptomyces phage Yosif]